MSIKDVLKPFKKRLTVEAWIRSAVLGGMIAACVAIVLGCVHVILPWMVTEIGILLTFVGVFCGGTGLLFLFVYRPTKQDTARRLDGLGMSERVETMLEYEHSTAPAARLQREETIDRLRGINRKDLKLKISKTLSALCAVFMVCATVLLFLPEINAFSRHPIINQLNQMMADANISEEFKEDLEEIIEELEEKLEDSENSEDKDQALKDAMEQIDKSVEKENSKKELGGLLQNYEDLKELGEAIQKGDQEGVSSALDKLKQEMKDNPGKQQSVADQLEGALNESQTDGENDLREALENMKNGLQDGEKPAEDTLDQAETEINNALGKQENAQMMGEQMKEQLGQNMSSGQGNEGEQEGGDASGAGGENTPGNGDTSSGNNSGSNASGAVGGVDGGQGGGIGGGQTNMKDKISDPQAGEVKYGEVYATYVAEFLAQVENGELSEDVVEAMNEYLEQLKNQN